MCTLILTCDAMDFSTCKVDREVYRYVCIEQFSVCPCVDPDMCRITVKTLLGVCGDQRTVTVEPTWDL